MFDPAQITTATAWSSYNFDQIRTDFPMLLTKVRGKPLIYLDNAATTFKPWSVIKRVANFDANEYSTVRRGAYRTGEHATELYENARQKVADFIGARSKNEIVFTSGATQSINLAAASFGGKFIREGDEIIISQMEHHSNIVPWQLLAERTGAIIKVIPVDDDGVLNLDEYEKLLSPKTRIVAVNHVSNVLGTINPVSKMAALAHDAGARILVDGAQAAPHMKVNVEDIDCDFYAFSAHKMYGPSGVGVLYGKMEILESMPPYVGGGDMIENVTFEKTTFAKPPSRFEAGTPPISQVIGWAEAINYLESIGMDAIARYEGELLRYGHKLLESIPGLRIIGKAPKKAGVISFVLKNAHPHDVVTLLDQDGIAVRGGHHCAQPTMQRFGVPATARASLAFYNKREELDALAESLRKIIQFFG